MILTSSMSKPKRRPWIVRKWKQLKKLIVEMSWRDPESAPKDGTMFMGYFPSTIWHGEIRPRPVVYHQFRWVGFTQRYTIGPNGVFGRGTTYDGVVHNPVKAELRGWKPMPAPGSKDWEDHYAEYLEYARTTDLLTGEKLT